MLAAGTPVDKLVVAGVGVAVSVPAGPAGSVPVATGVEEGDSVGVGGMVGLPPADGVMVGVEVTVVNVAV
jgi:hypothetical protein